MEPCKQISSNRINEIYMAFLFQRTNPPVMHIISLSDFKFGSQRSFLASLGKNNNSNGKFPVIIKLPEVQLFLWFLITSSAEDPSLPICALSRILRISALSECKVNLGGLKGWEAQGIYIVGQQNKLDGVSLTPFETARAETHLLPLFPLFCVCLFTPVSTSACWSSLEPLLPG